MSKYNKNDEVQFIGQSDKFVVKGDDPKTPGNVEVEWQDSKDKKRRTISVPEDTLEDYEDGIHGISMGNKKTKLMTI